MHQISKLKCFSSRLAVVFVQYIEAKCWMENEDAPLEPNNSNIYEYI